jgi:hypothetical protein
MIIYITKLEEHLRISGHDTDKQPVVGVYNQYQNGGNGYNAGYPFFGEHTYSGTGIYSGFFGKKP